MEYGTGAIMGVPGHDARDFEFATKFELPIVRVVCGEREDANTPLHEAFTECESGTLVNSGVFDGFEVEAAKKAIVELLAKGGSAEAGRSLSPARLVHLAPAVLGSADSDHLLRVVRSGAGAGEGSSGGAAVHRGLQARRLRCLTARAARGVVSRRVPEVREDGAPRDRRVGHFPRQRLVLPALSERRARRCPVREDDHEEVAARDLVHRRQRARGAAPALFAIHHDGLHDAGHLDFEEPFTRFRAHGHIIREGAKMSKTQGNIVNPDEYIEEWGADAFRTYLMFLGPYEQGGDFPTRASREPAAFWTGCSPRCRACRPTARRIIR